MSKKPDGAVVDNENFSDLKDKPYNSDLEQEIDERIFEELDAEEKSEESEDEELDLDKDDKDNDEELDLDKDEEEGSEEEEEPEEDKTARELKEKEEAEKSELLERAKKLELPESATKEEIEAKELENQIKDYAASEKISEEVAKKEIESIKGISEKYENDPKKMAKAFLHIQRSESKASRELKQLKDEVEADKNKDEITPEGIRYGGKFYEKKDLVAQYKDKYPALSKNQETGEFHKDDYIYDLVKQVHSKRVSDSAKKQLEEVEEEARSRRVTIVNSLTPENEKFSKGLEDLLDQTPDVEVVAFKQADIEDLLTFEMGRNYKADIKEVGDRRYKEGFEKGKEEAKILDVKEETPDSKGKGGQKPSGKKGTFKGKLNEAQQKEALEMYEDDDIPDETKFEYYLDYLKTDKEARDKLAS